MCDVAYESYKNVKYMYKEAWCPQLMHSWRTQLKIEKSVFKPWSGMFLGKTLYSQSSSLHPQLVRNMLRNFAFSESFSTVFIAIFVPSLPRPIPNQCFKQIQNLDHGENYNCTLKNWGRTVVPHEINDNHEYFQICDVTMQ